MSSRTLWALIATLAVGSCMFVDPARSQGIATASRDVQLSVFGGFSYVQPDFDSSFISHNLGWTVGGDLDLHPFHRLYAPGIEARLLHSTGTGAEAETLYAGGPRLQLHLGRLQPYAALLAGYGVLHYPQPVLFAGKIFTGDNAFVWSVAVGADYQMTTRWGARVDLMQQQWNASPDRFSPWALTAGVRYRFFAGSPQSR